MEDEGAQRGIATPAYHESSEEDQVRQIRDNIERGVKMVQSLPDVPDAKELIQSMSKKERQEFANSLPEIPKTPEKIKNTT